MKEKFLVIVESPAKAKTINKILGSQYFVVASMGHVRDLPKSVLGVDEENDFAPVYEVLASRKKVLTDIKKQAQNASAIFLAADPDREGEAICWHLREVLKGRGESPSFHRVAFNEITKNAVMKSFEHPGTIDFHKVEAQQARRILDRLVGYKISPLLWKKVRRGLSAGRVQSVALKMVVARERDIRAFKIEEYWSLQALLHGSRDPEFTADLVRKGGERVRIGDEAQALSIVRELEGLPYRLASITRKTRKRRPVPPFTTSKLQQDASRRLNFPVKKTMLIAQQLYEGVEIGSEGAIGLITYMRTDSPRVSDDALREVRSFIGLTYGNDLLPENPVRYASKKNSQDAHEAIRPTSLAHTPSAVKDFLTRDQLKLYTLIWNRFVASQMKEALYDLTQFRIAAGDYELRASGTILKFKGFLLVYEESSDKGAQSDNDDAPEAVLPELSEGETLELRRLTPDQHFTQPPPRYNEASLVKELEENGIGRPSTYATILSVIQNREYTVKNEGRFTPTELGELVAELLEENFQDIMDIGYTARLEETLDEVEEGKLPWVGALKEFNEKFSADLDRAKREMRNVKAEAILTDEVCEKCGKPMMMRWGKFGRFLACSDYPTCKNTRDVEKSDSPEPPPINGVEKCDKCGADMVQRKGRFGKFLACSKYPECKNTKRIVINQEGKPEVPRETPLDEKCPQCGSNLVIRTGRFGPFTACSGYPTCRYIKHKELGVSCPRPQCSGSIVEKKSKRGRTFYGCNRFPECDFVAWYPPVNRPCPKCASPFLVQKETKNGAVIACPEKECKYREEPPETPATDEPKPTRKTSRASHRA